MVAQMVKNLPARQETQVWPLGWEDPFEKEMATHSSILAWRIWWTKEPGGLQSLRSQRVGHDWTTNTFQRGVRNKYYLRKKGPTSLWTCSVFTGGDETKCSGPWMPQQLRKKSNSCWNAFHHHIPFKLPFYCQRLNSWPSVFTGFYIHGSNQSWMENPEGQLYSLHQALLYKRLEHLWILVPTGAPRTNPLQTPRGHLTALPHSPGSENSLTFYSFLIIY